MITIKCGRFSDHSSITTQHQPHAMAFISTGNIFILCSFLMQCAPFKEQPREEHIKATAATYNRALFSYCFLVSKKFNFLNLHQKKGGGGAQDRTGPLHSYERGESVYIPKPAFIIFKSSPQWYACHFDLYHKATKPKCL